MFNLSPLTSARDNAITWRLEATCQTCGAGNQPGLDPITAQSSEHLGTPRNTSSFTVIGLNFNLVAGLGPESVTKRQQLFVHLEIFVQVVILHYNSI